MSTRVSLAFLLLPMAVLAGCAADGGAEAAADGSPIAAGESASNESSCASTDGMLLAADSAEGEPTLEIPLPSGWEVAHEDTLGELVLALLTTLPEQRRGLSSSPLGIAEVRFTSSAADGWDGDRVLLARSADGVFVRLATRWDDEGEASEFATAVRAVSAALTMPLEVEHTGLFVVVTAAEGLDAAERAALEVAVTPRFA